MPTRTASEELNTQSPDRQELQRSTKRDRQAKAEDLEAKAIELRDATRRKVLARLMTAHPTASESQVHDWLQVDAEYLAAVERHEAAMWDLHEITNTDHRAIQPSKVETAVAKQDCAERRKSWSTFMRTLDRDTRRRHALRRRQQVPTGSTGRQARQSTSTRARGSKRTSSSGSSSSGGGDSGSSGDSDPSGQAQAGRETDNEHRYCRGCGLRLVGYAPQARDHGPACTTRWRRNDKVAAEPVDGVEYGPGCQSAAEIQQAIRDHAAGACQDHQQVSSDTELDEVLEKVEQAISDRRMAWVTGDSRSVERIDAELKRLWVTVRERKNGTVYPTNGRARGRRLHG